MDYTNLYVEEGRPCIDIEDCPCHGFPLISEELQRCFSMPVTKEEIETILFEMAPYKLPGEDDMHAGFYQRMWNKTLSKRLKTIMF